VIFGHAGYILWLIASYPMVKFIYFRRFTVSCFKTDELKFRKCP
jgi:hypothetical protein